MIQLHNLSPRFTILNRESRQRVRCDNRVRSRYEMQQYEVEGMVEGRLLNVMSIHRECIETKVVAYNDWKEQVENRRSPGIRPLAVTGVFGCEDGYLMGRRRSSAVEDPGLFEFVPAGGVEAIGTGLVSEPSPIRQLFKEAKEELLLDAEEIGTLQYLTCAENLFSGVIDLVYRAEIQLSTGEAKGRLQSVPVFEHTELMFIRAPWRDLSQDSMSHLTRRISRLLAESE